MTSSFWNIQTECQSNTMEKIKSKLSALVIKITVKPLLPGLHHNGGLNENLRCMWNPVESAEMTKNTF
jgi:hypothetical protein